MATHGRTFGAPRAKSAALVALVALAWSGVAHAYDKEAVDAPGWRYEIQPYASVPLRVTGTAAVLDRSVPVDVTASDLLKKLKLAGELRFEAWNGHWGLALDGAFARLADSKSRADLTFDLTSRTYLGQAFVAYRAGWWHGEARQPSFAVDLFAGGQVTRLSETLNIDAISRTASTTLGKGLLEARPVLRLSPTWALVGRLSVGAPDLVFSGGGAVELDLCWLALRLGYGYEKVNYSSSSDRLSLDVSSQGPYLGFGIRFGAGPIF